MPPLTRAETRTSILSWWSDRNPGLRGPTINLHAAAKPLMRLMYHRQAMDFIQKNRDAPLSREAVEILSSYLPLNYVFTGTKSVILENLRNRAIDRSADARTIIDDSFLLYQIEVMMESSDWRVRIEACMLWVALSKEDPGLRSINPCLFSSFISHKNAEVIEEAAYALSDISWWLYGAQAAVDAKLLDHIEELLISSNEGVQRWTCTLVRNLSRHQSIAQEILTMKPCPQLVSLLRHKNSEVIEQATYALCIISWWLAGAQAVVDAKLLDHIEELLISSNEGVQKWACVLVGNLFEHQSIAPVVLTTRPCIVFVALLRHKNAEVIEEATYALAHISQWLDGAQAVVDAKLLDHIQELLISSNEGVQRSTCNLVGNLASHESIAPHVLITRTCIPLLALLRHKNTEVIGQATYALSQISWWLDGAQAAVDAKVLDHIEELLICSNQWTQSYACTLVGDLASHESIAPAVLMMKPCPQLVSLLRHDDVQVIQEATYALYWISKWPNGAQAAVDAKVLDYIEELLGSSTQMVQRWACTLAGRLASHESIAPAVLTKGPCIQLVSLLRHDDVQVIQQATYALWQISQWPNGAQAAVDAKVLDYIEELLTSSNQGTQRCGCTLVAELASHESIAAEVLMMKPCPQLVSLLRHDDVQVIQQATYALWQISQWRNGAQAAVDAKVLDYIGELLISSNQGTQSCACTLVANLASHESIVPEVLMMKPCPQLVSLLCHDDVQVIQQATYALWQISQWPNGAQAAVDAKVLDYIGELLISSNQGTQSCACTLVANLASHESIVPEVLMMKPCPQLVSLLCHDDVQVIQRATYALHCISKWPNGAQAAVDAKVLDYIEELLGSSTQMVQRWACTLAGRLASHKSIAPEVLTMDPCIQLVALMRHKDMEVIEEAAFALWRISFWPTGAQAVIDAKVLDHVVRLLGSPIRRIRSCTSGLVRNLASHDSTAPAITEFTLCVQLISILDDEDQETVTAAIYVLCRASKLRRLRSVVKSWNVMQEVLY
ncbi:armadillo-type protein [Mycena maculata]|uniref:Armadillo-type protein n=1 Tax=Mycena maculata TaxID=230809 RepID=A0AAD7IZE7_9AGAR|nr:armadillo-type protein [Mycena maculata]